MAQLLRSLSRRFTKGKSTSTSPNQFDSKTQILCKVILLDDDHINIVLDKKALGQDACNKVFMHLDLEETDYFGLTFTDHDNIQNFLDPYKKIRKQIPTALQKNPTLSFKVRFFSSEPANIRGEFTRYLFFLQLKQDIRTGKLFCPKDSAIQLAALQLQSECGNYDPKEHSPAFVSTFRFHPDQDETMEIEILKKYVTLVGKSPAEAEREYLDLAKMLQFYGVDLHDVIAKDNNNYRLGLTPTGVVVFDKEVLVGVLFWQFIQAVNFSNRRLTIILDEHSSTEIQQHTFVFTLTSNRACKKMWRRAVEFHSFYRMRKNRPTRRNPGEQFFRLSSSYQHRGRTEFENVNQPPQRRERSVVTFERKPSQRYCARQSHVERLKQYRANVLQKTTEIQKETIIAESQLPSQSTSTNDDADTSIDGANRTYTVSKNESILKSDDVKQEPIVKEASPPSQNIAPHKTLPAPSRLPRFGKNKNSAQPRLYELPPAEDSILKESENFDVKTNSTCVSQMRTSVNGSKTTFIPIIQSSTVSSRVITQL
ncbi:Moesin/ezrin/radixin-like protein 1 [Aphelenchoides besseyi]|nr:Moesin/ezrin/radixin-like protein 1 [Aphelenchoides besseyi]KAI6235992.1 Moesin/ezrin/radixin-like protein 1 [Aphelenchoides besseyi]